MDPTSSDALRIQAAAVVAQQAAVFEDEARLHARGRTLEQQEHQLAATLGEKRRRLISLRDEVKNERAALHAEQTQRQQILDEKGKQLDADQVEVADNHAEVRTERRRLLRLRKRLRARWHRNWARERNQVKRREASLDECARQIENDKQRIAKEREALERLRLEVTGEAELSRRETDAAAASLQEDREKLREQASHVAARKQELVSAERELIAEKRRWHREIAHLQRESQGLKNRIQNQRCKLVDLERRASRLTRIEKPPEPEIFIAVGANDSTSVAHSADTDRARELEVLAGELADQRLRLTEQWQRFLIAQQDWAGERDNSAAQLEELARSLGERERAVESVESTARQRNFEVDRKRRYHHGLEVQWNARLSSWHGERERLLSELRIREEHLTLSQASVAGQLRKWQQRYQNAAQRLKTEYASCKAEQQKYIAACQSGVADREDPQTQRPEDRFAELAQWAAELAAKDSEVLNLLSTVENGRVSAGIEVTRLRHDVKQFRSQNLSYQRQLAELHEELERIARMLIADGDPEAQPIIGQAA